MFKLDSDKVINIVGEFSKEIKDLKVLKIKELNPNKTALVFVDVINGFIYEGALHDKAIAKIIPECEKLLEYGKSNGMRSVAFADCHLPEAAEFESFPVHCVKGHRESLVVENLCKIGGYTLIEKNSTNGFHAPDFQKFIKENEQLENFIICGDCTDICVMNFAVTLKTYFDQQNKKARLIVPVNMTETYDSPAHSREFMNAAALIFMRNAGIELVGGIDFD